MPTVNAGPWIGVKTPTPAEAKIPIFNAQHPLRSIQKLRRNFMPELRSVLVSGNVNYFSPKPRRLFILRMFDHVSHYTL